MPHGHLFRCRLGVNLHDCRLNRTAQRMSLQHRLDRTKRIVKRALHEYLPKHLHHQNPAALCGGKDFRAATRRDLGKVQGPDNSSVLFAKTDHVFLVKSVVAKGHTIGPGGEQVLGMVSSQTGPLRGVFGVHHNKVQPPGLT
jgi:hypothetical protein